MSLHFIAMYGKRGCLPESCQAFTNRNKAIDHLVFMLELPPHGAVANRLRTFGYSDLQQHLYWGAEYASITKCTCDDPEIHNDYEDD